MTAEVPSLSPWTCPFCSLLSDGFVPDPGHPARLLGSDCPRAQAGLAAHLRTDGGRVEASIDGVACTMDDAVAAAAQRRKNSG